MADELNTSTTTTATDDTYKTKSYKDTVDELNTMYSNNQNAINQTYDSQLAQNKANLESAYQQNKSNYEASAKSLRDTYADSSNALSAEYERQRRNTNIQALNSGLNTGARSQMALGQATAYQNSAATLSKQLNADLAENQRNIDDLTSQYNIAVNEAIANNDYQRASALFDEYNNNYSRMKDAENTAYTRAAANADLMAEYGDFSGYVQLGSMTQEQADAAAVQWQYKNPLLAYNLGKIDASRYYALTGSYPPGTVVSSGGGGGSGSGYSSPKSQTTPVQDMFTVYNALKSNGSSEADATTYARGAYLDAKYGGGTYSK